MLQIISMEQYWEILRLLLFSPPPPKCIVAIVVADLTAIFAKFAYVEDGHLFIVGSGLAYNWLEHVFTYIKIVIDTS